MKTLVINLEQVTERHIFQTAQLNALGLEFDFFKAIEADDADRQRKADFWRTWQRPLRNSEKACFLSHRGCWEKTAELNEPILILEDDALLSDKVPDFLAKVERFNHMDILSLETRGRKKLLESQKSDQEFKRMYLDRDGAAAYILWPSGAQKLIECSNKTVGLADAYLWNNFNLISYQSYPALALQSDQCRHYNIPEYLETRTSMVGINSPSARRGDNLIEYIKYRMRRFWGQVQLAKAQILHFNKSEKEELTIMSVDFEYLKAFSSDKGTP